MTSNSPFIFVTFEKKDVKKDHLDDAFLDRMRAVLEEPLKSLVSQRMRIAKEASEGETTSKLVLLTLRMTFDSIIGSHLKR